MANINCYAARGINILFGLIALFLAIVLLVSGFSFMPFFGFVLSAAVFGFSFRFFFAPRDKTCTLPEQR